MTTKIGYVEGSLSHAFLVEYFFPSVKKVVEIGGVEVDCEAPVVVVVAFVDWKRARAAAALF